MLRGQRLAHGHWQRQRSSRGRTRAVGPNAEGASNRATQKNFFTATRSRSDVLRRLPVTRPFPFLDPSRPVTRTASRRVRAQPARAAALQWSLSLRYTPPSSPSTPPPYYSRPPAHQSCGPYHYHAPNTAVSNMYWESTDDQSASKPTSTSYRPTRARQTAPNARSHVANGPCLLFSRHGCSTLSPHPHSLRTYM